MKISHIFLLLLTISLAGYLYLTKNMLGLILVTGFLDGIHPCGFTVLLFFIAFMLSLKRPRTQIIVLGCLYILGVFLAYFTIGLGIMKAVTLFEPEFMAKVGAILLMIIGAISIKDGLTGTNSLKIPEFTAPHLSNFLEKGTMLTVFIAGVLVGLCAFPCVGGLYVAIITLLSVKGFEIETFGLLALYNLMFVAPLLLALFLASDEKILEKLDDAEKKNHKNFKLIMGGIMFIFGLYILFVSVM